MNSNKTDQLNQLNQIKEKYSQVIELLFSTENINYKVKDELNLQEIQKIHQYLRNNQLICKLHKNRENFINKLTDEKKEKLKQHLLNTMLQVSINKEKSTIKVIEENITSSNKTKVKVEKCNNILPLQIHNVSKLGMIQKYYNLKKKKLLCYIDYKNNSIENILYGSPDSITYKRENSVSNPNFTFLIHPLYPKDIEMNRNHLIPYCLTGIEHDFRLVIMASSKLNTQFQIFENMFKDLIKTDVYYYYTKAIVNKENELIINQKILNSKHQVILQREFKEFNYYFNPNLISLKSIK